MCHRVNFICDFFSVCYLSQKTIVKTNSFLISLSFDAFNSHLKVRKRFILLKTMRSCYDVIEINVNVFL